MSHDTHHGHSGDKKPVLSFTNSFWLIIILVGLFVAALNFIRVESAGEEGEKGEGKEKTEMRAGGEEPKGEHAQNKAETPKGADTVKQDTSAPGANAGAEGHEQ